MKKIMILAVAVCFAGAAANAQDVYKQTGGEKNIEVQFAPFGASPIAISGIKFRSFTSASEAWRGEVFIGFGSTSDVFDVVGNTDAVRNTNSFDVSLAFGKEWHLPGTDRLSPYYGGYAQVGFGSDGSRRDLIGFNNAGDRVINGEEKVSDGELSLGAFAVGGFDYYFAHNIYLGAEIGFGALFTTLFDTTTERTVDSETTTTEVPNGSRFNVGPAAQARLRLGILF